MVRTTDNVCVRTAHTLHLGFKVCAAAGKVCGTATHAVGGDAGYGLLTSPELAATLTDVTVDLETRAQERPSDHAPVIAEFDC